MTNVHLLGSVGLDSVDEVFAAAGRILGAKLKRVPDGEPGGRRAWIAWQWPVLTTNPFLEIDERTPAAPDGYPQVRLADGVRPEELRFGELGYAREARASYQDFQRARDAGLFAPPARFQVSLPTPICVVARRVAPDHLAMVEAAYEAAMLHEIERIAAAIPHRDLCIQWDMTREIIWWDGRLKSQPAPFADVEREVMARLRRLGAAVPADVELGFHLCYGDNNARHFIEPQDMGKMVEFANAITAQLARPVSYFHMPVPIERDDDPYFAPLAGLSRGAGTELYLGLVHLRDGAAGARRRMASARKYVAEFGIGSECGLSRRKRPEDVLEILRIHAAAARD